MIPWSTQGRWRAPKGVPIAAVRVSSEAARPSLERGGGLGMQVERVGANRSQPNQGLIELQTSTLPPQPPGSNTSIRTGFALMLETACEDFEILQRLIRQETTVVSSHQRDKFRAAFRIQMALAKSFVFHAVRARRICEHGHGSLGIDRLERTRFLKGTEGLLQVRDVNEHGFDANASSKPSMHHQDGGSLDETSMVTDTENKILMGPLNLYDMYVPTARMRALAGFASLHGTMYPDMPPPPEPPLPIRLLQYLDIMTGGDKAAAFVWLTTPNSELGCVPGDKTRGSVEGLAEVVT